MRRGSVFSRMASVLLASMTMVSLPMPPGALAQTSIVDRIKERAKMREDVLALLKSNDPAMAIAAFEEAVVAEDPELRLSAYEIAFNSQDQRLRKSALRHFLDGRGEIRMEVLLPDRPDKAQQFLFDVYNGYRFPGVKVDSNSDIISFDKRTSNYWSGQLVNDGFDLTYTDGYDTCVMNMRIADAERLTGQFNCVFRNGNSLQKSDGVDHGAVPVQIRLS